MALTREQKEALFFFQSKTPEVLSWIENTLRSSDAQAEPLSSLGLNRLERYFSRQLLEQTRVVCTAQLPIPPLDAMGLSIFQDFKELSLQAITYKNTYFLTPEHRADISLHFHELIHVIQWNYLGPEQFLLAYAIELFGCGYEDNYFERMAKALESRFNAAEEIFNAEKLVINELETYF